MKLQLNMECSINTANTIIKYLESLVNVKFDAECTDESEPAFAGLYLQDPYSNVWTLSMILTAAQMKRDPSYIKEAIDSNDIAVVYGDTLDDFSDRINV